MQLLVLGREKRQQRLLEAVDRLWPGCSCTWAGSCFSLEPAAGTVTVFDLGLWQEAPGAWEPRLRETQSLVLVGTEGEWQALPPELRQSVRAYVPLESRGEEPDPAPMEGRAYLEGYLTDLSRGSSVTLAQSQRAARLLGVPARGRALAALYLEPGGTRAAAAMLEEALGRASCPGACAIPWGTGALAILDLGRNAGRADLEQLCLRLRGSLRDMGQTAAVTIGAAGPETDPGTLPSLTVQAELAAFYQIYDGPGRTYVAGRPDCAPTGRAFPEMEHLGELNRAADRLDPELFRIALRHMFDDLIACRLGRGQLRRILTEVMSLLLSLGVDGEIPTALWGSGPTPLNFEFVYHMEHIEVEYESFLQAFLGIIQYLRQKNQRVQQYSCKVRRVMEFIEENYAQRLELTALAEMADLSANYLCYLFKKETGFRVVEYINLIRMERAKELLGGRGLSAAQAAEQVGFVDTAYFCTMFKRFTGQTVTEFRNRAQ